MVTHDPVAASYADRAVFLADGRIVDDLADPTVRFGPRPHAHPGRPDHMFTLTLKSIRANKARFVLTGVAVMLGVAFMAGTLVLTDTIKQSYDDVAGQRVQGHRRRRALGTARRRTTTASEVRGTHRRRDRSTRSRAVPGVAGRRGAGSSASRSSSATTATCSTPAATGRSRSRWRGRPTPALNPMELVAGHAPRAPDEIVIDRASGRQGRVRASARRCSVVEPGRHAASTARRRRDVRRRRRRGRRAGRGVRARDGGAGARHARSLRRRSSVVAAPGVSQAELVAEHRDGARTTPTSRCITGAAGDRRGPQGSRRRRSQFLNMFLMTFAIVALLVGSFVIYNTFSITVAQRTQGDRAAAGDRRQAQAGHAVGDARGGRSPACSPRRSVWSPASARRKGICARCSTAFGFELPAAGTVVNPSTIIDRRWSSASS